MWHTGEPFAGDALLLLLISINIWYTTERGLAHIGGTVYDFKAFYIFRPLTYHDVRIPRGGTRVDLACSTLVCDQQDQGRQLRMEVCYVKFSHSWSGAKLLKSPLRGWRLGRGKGWPESRPEGVCGE